MVQSQIRLPQSKPSNTRRPIAGPERVAGESGIWGLFRCRPIPLGAWGIGVAAQAGPPTEHLASGPYADHHLLCVNGAMTGTRDYAGALTEFPPMRHSGAPHFQFRCWNQTDAINSQFERKQE
jgi:hypothetical protein